MYFDSLLVGLTATPKDEVDANTYELFNCESGEPNFAYSLEEAVTEKYLVPYKVESKTTQLLSRGIKYGEDYCQLIDNQVKGADQLIINFGENEQFRIAVSVDMLDTGIDVPSVLNLVFFKPIKSKIKFVQMIGRGTRLCENLIDGKDKNFFLIFDYCANFEYFGKHPDGLDNANGKSVSQRLFDLKMDILVELQSYEHQTDVICKAYYERLKPELFQKIQEMKSHSSRMSVREQMSIVDKYCDYSVWESIAPLQKKEIQMYLSHLVDNDTKEDKRALQFDTQMLRIEVSVLASGITPIDINEVDEVMEGEYTGDTLMDIRTYKERVVDYLNEHHENDTIKKIQNLDPINATDLKELERILWHDLGTAEDYQNTTDIDNLAVFIRSIVGVEQKAINEKFGEFLDDNVMNSQQQEFVKAIIDYVRENGDIKTEDLIEKSPFDHYDILELFGNNVNIITNIVNRIHNSVTAA